MKEFLDLYPDSGPNAGTGPWSRAHPIPFDHEPPTPDLEPRPMSPNSSDLDYILEPDEEMMDARIADDPDDIPLIHLS